MARRARSAVGGDVRFQEQETAILRTVAGVGIGNVSKGDLRKEDRAPFEWFKP
jgi:hypothetical protein